jgi:hypothetical protein
MLDIVSAFSAKTTPCRACRRVPPACRAYGPRLLTSSNLPRYCVLVARNWIDEGLRHTQEREEQQRLACQRRLHQTAVVKEQGPDLMRRLVAEVGAVLSEYRHEARLSEIEFEALPREGFCVTKAKLPRVSLECRPDYDAHVVYCNMTRADDHEGDTRESVFNLDITVDNSDTIALRHETKAFQTLDEVVEFLLKPVLFPPLNQGT